MNTNGSEIIKHLSHLEDLIIEEGYEGIIKFIDIVENINKTKIKVKIDGSPSIFFGIDYRDNKFFVATKGIDNNIPNLVKSLDDIKNIKGPKKQIENAFKELSKLIISSSIIYQVDYLFDEDSREYSENFFSCFTPNTITYITKAITCDKKIGLAIHTKYSYYIDSNGKFNMSKIELNKYDDIFNQTTNHNIYMVQTDLNKPTKNLIIPDLSYIKSQMPEFKKLTEVLNAYPEFKKRLSIFINSQLNKEDSGIFGFAQNNKSFQPENLIYEFICYIKNYFSKEIETVKKEDNILKKYDTYENWIKLIDNNMILFFEMFSIYYQMILIKNDLCKQLSTFDFELSSFIDINGKLEESNGEGYVVTWKNMSIKLVNRVEFSKINRMKYNK